jgi:putative acetyltransferase
MNLELVIRLEQPGDEAAVRAVNEQAFAGLVEAGIVNRLRKRGKALVSLVATDGEQVLGHILFSQVTLEPPRNDLRLIGLAPMAVLPEYQRQGIGTTLVSAGLQHCRDLDFDAVVVLGYPTYYPRFGFSKGSDFGLTNEYGEDEAFMVLELRTGSLQGVQGLVRYAPEFAGDSP